MPGAVRHANYNQRAEELELERARAGYVDSMARWRTMRATADEQMVLRKWNLFFTGAVAVGFVALSWLVWGPLGLLMFGALRLLDWDTERRMVRCQAEHESLYYLGAYTFDDNSDDPLEPMF